MFCLLAVLQSRKQSMNTSQYLLKKTKKEDLEGFASKITPINKTDEEMKADWFAKITLKGDDFTI